MDLANFIDFSDPLRGMEYIRRDGIFNFCSLTHLTSGLSLAFALLGIFDVLSFLGIACSCYLDASKSSVSMSIPTQPITLTWSSLGFGLASLRSIEWSSHVSLKGPPAPSDPPSDPRSAKFAHLPSVGTWLQWLPEPLEPLEPLALEPLEPAKRPMETWRVSRPKAKAKQVQREKELQSKWGRVICGLF